SLFNAAGLTPFGAKGLASFKHADLEGQPALQSVVHACLRNDGGNGILHAVLMHGWLAVVPHTTIWLRMPSAILGLLVILLTVAMTRDLSGDRHAALLAGALAAWSVLLLQGSLELR